MHESIAAKCNDCIAGPSGIGGHDNLFMAAGDAKGTTIFSCSMCRAFWARSYQGSGQFLWEALSETSNVQQVPLRAHER